MGKSSPSATSCLYTRGIPRRDYASVKLLYFSFNFCAFVKRLHSFVRRRFAFAKRSRFRQTLMLFRPTAFRFCKTLTVSPNAYALSSDGVSLL
ncbi:MAG: hypothetical protein DBY05_11630, partial [Clostridiales bacterium]